MKKKLVFLTLSILTILISIYLFKIYSTTKVIKEDDLQKLNIYTTIKYDKNATYIPPGTYTLTGYVQGGTNYNIHTSISDTNYKKEGYSQSGIINLLTTTTAENILKVNSLDNMTLAPTDGGLGLADLSCVGRNVPSPLTTDDFYNRSVVSHQSEFTIQKNQYIYIYTDAVDSDPYYQSYEDSYYTLNKNTN